MVAISCSLCTLNLINRKKGPNLIPQRFCQDATAATKLLSLGTSVKVDQPNSCRKRVCFSTKATESEESVPSWAKPDADEPPPWARDEGKKNESKEGFELPFYVYLLASTITAIAAVGSIFEYANQNPVFGVLNSDSVFYAPVLGFFVFTGFPTSAFLWFKSVQVANKEAEEQDRRDGYL